MSPSVPGPKARSQRSTSPLTPSATPDGDSSSPSHRAIDVQRGREVVHTAALDARTILPAADSVVSTRGPTGTAPPHDFPSP